jgi:RHS repeat-associated protein
VIPNSPTEAEQRRTQEEARRSSPEAVVAREESQTKYEGLDSEQAAKLAGEAFPEAFEHPAGALPSLPAGQRIVGYPTDNAAQVELPEGKHGVIESMEPISTETSPGHREPLDLGLAEVGDVFQPERSDVGVRIPKQLANGVELTSTGVSLTPIDEHGLALGGAQGAIDGATVLYANTQTDTDTIVKPLASGFEEDTLLRSAESPPQLFFRVGLPQGASLAQAHEASGAVEVLEAKKAIAAISPPTAQDAAGTSVPVSMSVAGSTLTLSVDEHAGEYELPIMVDPTVVDTRIAESNWDFATNAGYDGNKGSGVLEDWSPATGGWGVWGYATQGESHIYEFISESNSSGSDIENELAIVNSSKKKEAFALYSASYGNTRTELCSQGGCVAGTVTAENKANVASFEQISVGQPGSFTAKVTSSAVGIVQEKGPTAGFNFSSPTFEWGGEKITNVLYAGGWLGFHAGAFEVTASDPGVGVDEMTIVDPSDPKSSRTVNEGCVGVQCAPTAADLLAAPGSVIAQGGEAHIMVLPEGEDKVEVKPKDGVGLTASSTPATIKVDSTAPHSITLTGLPPNKEIGGGEYHVKAGATDGAGSTPSSGVESLVLKVDGRQVGGPVGSCSPGPCTASGEWIVSGSEFAVGQHEVTVTATDRAKNVATEKFTMFVARPTTPIAMGPGSVDPSSGEFKLSGADVSVSAPGGSLSVSRSFGSMHTTVGAEGPLGPQWSLSLGGGQNLTKLPDGDMLLTDGTGLQAVYTSKGAGEFTAPKGDEGLVLSEKKVGETVEFTLKGSSGSVTTFTPSGGVSGTVWLPTIREQADGLNVSKITYQIVGSITEPTEMLAPVPAGVSCSSELVKGCRALKFVYATKTTATGDGQSEWGDYEGHLKEITLTAWNPSSGKMVTEAVAQYQYDKEGKLRAEWNPLIVPSLKTIYGYDAEGRITAVSASGQQPWLATYGAIAGDARTGRLLAGTRPSATTAFGNGVAPANSARPALSTTTPVFGKVLSVTVGTWSNSPLGYEYQWEDCHIVESKEVCTPILGATDRTYTPAVSDKGYELDVKVTATNSDGSITATSNKSSAPSSPTIGGYEHSLEIGKEGTAEGDFKKPDGVSVDKYGNVWVADTGNNRIEEFSSTGAFRHAYGEKEQFKEPKDVVVDENGYIFVADSGNDRIAELEPSGTEFGSITTPSAPSAIAIRKAKFDGNWAEVLYVTLPASNEVVKDWVIEGYYEFVQKGTFGTVGSGNGQFKTPTGIAINEAGTLVYVTDSGNHRVQVLKVVGSESELNLEYSTKFGTQGSGNGQFSTPSGIAVEPESLETLSEHNPFTTGLNNGVLVTDPGDSRWQQFSSAYAYQVQYSEKEAQSIAISAVKGKTAGTVYVANPEKSEITEWAPGLPPASPPEPPSSGGSAITTIDYHVPVTGTGAAHALGSKEVEAWGQTDDPVEATAVFPPDEPMGWPAKDYKRASVYYLDSKGRTVNTASPSGAIATAEYNTTNDTVRTLSPDNRQAALNEGSKSKETAKLLDSESTYNSEGTELLGTLGPQHTVKLANGSEVQARNHSLYSYNEGAPAEGGPYNLVTKVTDGAQYSGKEEDVRTTTTSYSGQENLGWSLRKPTSVTTDPSGLKLTTTTLYEAATGQVSETRMPASPGTNSPHDTQTIYYTTAKNTSVPACGEHPEWANLPCQVQPAKQPETSGIPNLPVATATYNRFDEPEKATETVGSKTRTKTATYDTAGRLKTSAISSTVGTALPTVTDEYSSETGALVKQCSNEGKPCTEGKPKTTTSAYNTLGELTSYTDADENTATYNYDIDGRVEKTNDGKGTQTYTYDPTTGFSTKLVDSAAGTFTATYDAEGNMLTEGYPNGMSGDYAYNQEHAPTKLEYIKTTYCTEKCTWFSDAVVPSIHGQLLEQTNTLSHDAYTYDAAGRLTQVQDTPSGKGCTTRIYAYDEDTNRTSLTTREPGSKGECTSTGGTVEKHTYDTADRLTDTGTKYSEFGNITALPAADAGGSELTSAFYADNQLASQTQNGETIGYNLDPSGRTREIVSTGKTSQDVINHYAANGNSPAWTIETPSGNWTRNIQGIGGGLAAIQVNGATPELQLTDLHGNIIATAALSETETKLLSTQDTTEYGVPTTATPPKYSWLGGGELQTELSSGVIAMGARSYVPQLGRFLQTDPIPGGSANAYAYVFGDPVNESDPSGESGLPQWFLDFAAENAQQRAEEYAVREKVAQEEAMRRAEEAWAAASKAADAEPGGSEGSLGGSSGWLCEDAGATGQEVEGCGGGGGCSGDNACAASAGSEWVCTLAGTVVAAGVAMATSPTGPGAAALSILAGGSFTAGCELGSSSNRTYVSGLSHPSNCFDEWTLSKRTHKYNHRTEECYA